MKVYSYVCCSYVRVWWAVLIERQMISCSKLENAFLCVKRWNWKTIHCEIDTVYGEHAISHPGTRLCKTFEDGHTELIEEYEKGDL